MLYAQKNALKRDRYRIKIARTIEAIKIDGVLDEKAWQISEKAENFIRVTPVDTGFAIAKTTVVITYDKSYLYVLHLPEEEITSKNGLVQHYINGRAALPGAKQTVVDIIAQGNKVAFRGVLNAVQPNEKEINVTFTGFWKIQNEKVVEWFSEYDALGMMRQLGMELQMKQATE